MTFRSLNEPYGDIGRFHARLVDLAKVRASDSVLDLGCGLGHSLPPLLARAAEVVALDVNPSFLAKASATNEAAVASGQLAIVESNAAEGLLFEGERFDRVICQNMLECLQAKDRPALIAEVYRVLRPGGTLLLGHHDFAGVILHSKDEALTRQLIQTYATLHPEWAGAAEGDIGRKLPGLVRASDFASAEAGLEPLTALTLEGNTGAEAFCHDLVEAGRRGEVKAAALDGWLTGLRELDAEGAFFLAVPWVHVKATKQSRSP
jgi:ubiquinone/menaquinone biosynthesis C-methylase UbiE